VLAVFVNFPCLKLRSSYTGCAFSIHVLKWDVTSNQGFGSCSASYSKSQVEVLIFHHMLCPSFFLFIHFKRERHLKLGFFLGSLPLVFIPCLKLRSSFAVVHPSIHIPKTGCHVKLGFGGAQLFYSMSQN